MPSRRLPEVAKSADVLRRQLVADLVLSCQESSSVAQLIGAQITEYFVKILEAQDFLADRGDVGQEPIKLFEVSRAGDAALHQHATEFANPALQKSLHVSQGPQCCVIDGVTKTRLDQRRQFQAHIGRIIIRKGLAHGATDPV